MKESREEPEGEEAYIFVVNSNLVRASSLLLAALPKLPFLYHLLLATSLSNQ
jgi:hypothetical protein